MRLGEIKQKIDEVTNSQNQIEFLLEDQGNGYTYTIKNLKKILDFAQLAIELKIGNANEEVLKSILSSEPGLINNQISTNSYTQLQNSVITPINQSLLQIYPFIDYKVKLQDNQVINIKLPNNIYSFDDLSKQISTYNTIFKKVKINSGEVKFNGLDSGTSWVEILIVGKFMYDTLLGVIKLGKEFYEFKRSYYGSEKAKKDCMASIDKEEVTDKEVEQFSERRIEIEIKHNVSDFLTNIKIEDKQIDNLKEFKVGIISAAKDISIEIEKGSEFRLSLNPPEYVKEEGGLLNIDFSKIESIELESEPKQLTSTIN